MRCDGQIYFFCQIPTFIKVCGVFVFRLQTLLWMNFTKIFQLKHLKPKHKGHTNFYECCNLMKKVYLCRTVFIFFQRIIIVRMNTFQSQKAYIPSSAATSKQTPSFMTRAAISWKKATQYQYRQVYFCCSTASVKIS